MDWENNETEEKNKGEKKTIATACNTKLLMVKFVFFCYYTGGTFSFPFIANYFSEYLGLDFNETAVILGFGPFVGLISRPLLSYLADMIRRPKVILLLTMAVHVASWQCLFILHPRPTIENGTFDPMPLIPSTPPPAPPTPEAFDVTFWAALTLIALLLASESPVEALIDSLTFDELGNATNDYGKQRMWGTIGYMIFSVVSGFGLNHLGDISDTYWIRVQLTSAFKGSAALFALFIGMNSAQTNSQTSPKTEAPSDLISSRSQSNEVQPLITPQRLLPQLTQLLSNYRVLAFLSSIFVIGCFVGFYNSYHGLFLETVLLASQTQMGISYAVGTLSEAIMFQFSGTLNARFGPDVCLVVSFFGYFLRFLGYFLVKSAWLILLVETLHSVTFALSWTTTAVFANAIAPAGLGATLQGIAGASFINAGGAVGCLVGGVLYGALSGRRVYLCFGSTALFVGIVYLILILNGKRICEK